MADPAYRFQVIPINQLQLRKLIARRIDVVPMSLVTAFAQIREEGLEGKLDYLPKPLKSSPYYHVWCKARADADTPALMAAYDAELLHMKRDGRLKALYGKYGIPYRAELAMPEPAARTGLHIAPYQKLQRNQGLVWKALLRASRPAGWDFAVKSTSRWTGSRLWSGSCGSAPSATRRWSGSSPS